MGSFLHICWTISHLIILFLCSWDFCCRPDPLHLQSETQGNPMFPDQSVQNKTKSYFLALMSFFTETVGDFSPWWDSPYRRDNLYSTQLCLLSTHFCSEKSSRNKTPVLVRSLAALIAATSECPTWHCPPLRTLLVFLFHREVMGSKSILPFRHRQKPKLVFKFAF